MRQFVRYNDLGACVDRGLCIVGLSEAILRLHDAAFRIGEVALRLGIGLVRRRRRRFARLLAAFGLALLAFRPRYDALPPPPAWRPPPAPPSLAGSSPAVSACRRPNPASRRRACLCSTSRPLRNPPPRRLPACELGFPFCLAFLH